jgi:hypothetical protein
LGESWLVGIGCQYQYVARTHDGISSIAEKRTPCTDGKTERREVEKEEEGLTNII